MTTRPNHSPANPAIIDDNMKRFRSLLLIVLGVSVGLPVGWCLRGRSVAAREALLHNLVEIEKAKQQVPEGTNGMVSTKP